MRANRRERNHWRIGRHEALHLGGSLIRQLHHRLRHGRVPGVASLANLVAVGFAVPVRRHVQAQRAHGNDQHNCNKRRSPLGRHVRFSLKFTTLARCPAGAQYKTSHRASKPQRL